MAQGTELPRIIDEEDEEENHAPGPHGHNKNGNGKKEELSTIGALLGEEPDWDSIFAYKTFKIVRIKDASLGMLYWSLVTMVIMYIICVAFFLEGKHAQNAPGFGTIMTRYKGKVVAKGKVFDEADLRFPTIEPTGLFLVTKRIVMKNQEKGTCVDMDSPRRCSDQEPCPKGEECDGEWCATQGWCPSLGEKNADSPPDGADVERMEGLEHSLVQIMTSITFPGISDRIYVAGASEWGMKQNFKNITLGDLIGSSQPAVKFEDILEKGALIGVSFSWSCDVTVECEPTVVVKHLDGGKGFEQKRSRIHRKDGKEVRDAIYMTGVRVLVDSQGVGRKVSLVLIVIQVGSGLALLRVATMAADFLMLHLYSADRCKAYYKCKVIETRDYSDLQDRIHLIQDAPTGPEGAQILGAQSFAGTSGSGAGLHVPLGLGPGARGGSASAVLRGRGSAAG